MESTQKNDLNTLLEQQFNYYARNLFYSCKSIEWRPLGICCKILKSKGKGISKDQRIAGPFPYYGANGIIDYINDYVLDGTFILIGNTASVTTKNGTPLIHVATGKIYTGGHVHVIEERDGVLFKYLFYYLKSLNISKLITGSILLHFYLRDLERISVPVPPISEQTKIIGLLDELTRLHILASS